VGVSLQNAPWGGRGVKSIPLVSSKTACLVTDSAYLALPADLVALRPTGSSTRFVFKWSLRGRSATQVYAGAVRTVAIACDMSWDTCL
jgi:hypothetical protein